MGGLFKFFQKASSFDPVSKYVWNHVDKPIATIGAGKKLKAENARREEANRQQRIREGRASIDSALAPFNDPYYRQKNTQYQNYYGSQVDQQHQRAQDALKLQLSTSGLGRSSAAGFGMGELGSEYARNMADVNLKGNEYEQGVRRDVEGIRGTLNTQLNSSADAALAAQRANMQAADQFKKADNFAPLASVFSDFSKQYKNDQNNRLLSNALDLQYNSPFQQAMSGMSSGAGKAWKLLSS